MTRKTSTASGARIFTGITSGAALVAMVAGFHLTAQAEEVVGNLPEVLPVTPSAVPESATPATTAPSAEPAPDAPAVDETSTVDTGTDVSPTAEAVPDPVATVVAPEQAPPPPPAPDPTPVPTPTATSRAS